MLQLGTNSLPALLPQNLPNLSCQYSFLRWYSNHCLGCYSVRRIVLHPTMVKQIGHHANSYDQFEAAEKRYYRLQFAASCSNSYYAIECCLLAAEDQLRPSWRSFGVSDVSGDSTRGVVLSMRWQRRVESDLSWGWRCWSLSLWWRGRREGARVPITVEACYGPHCSHLCSCNFSFSFRLCFD